MQVVNVTRGDLNLISPSLTGELLLPPMPVRKVNRMLVLTILEGKLEVMDLLSTMSTSLVQLVKPYRGDPDEQERVPVMMQVV